MSAATRASNPDVAIRIVQAKYNSKLSATPLASTEEGQKDVIDLITRLRIMVGQNKDVTPVQLEIEAKFLRNNYSNFTPDDIELAIELFLNGRLGVPLPTHVTFSPLFIAHLMNAYARYSQETIKEVDENSRRQIMLLGESSAEERLNGIKECITDCHKHGEEGFAERFYNNLVYDFLVNTSRIVVGLSAGSEEYAIKRYEEDQARHKRESRQNKDAKPVMSVLRSNPSVEYDKGKALKQYAIDFMLIQYFKKNSLKKILDSITTADLK